MHIIVSLLFGILVGSVTARYITESRQSIVPTHVIEATKACIPSTFETLAINGEFTCRNGVTGKVEIND